MNENIIEKEKSVGTEGITSVTSLPVVTPSSHDLSVDDKSNKTCLYLLYDERMTLHSPIGWTPCSTFPTCAQEIPAGYTFENPERIRRIYERDSYNSNKMY
jgi:hypothetical protein